MYDFYFLAVSLWLQGVDAVAGCRWSRAYVLQGNIKGGPMCLRLGIQGDIVWRCLSRRCLSQSCPARAPKPYCELLGSVICRTLPLNKG